VQPKNIEMSEGDETIKSNGDGIGSSSDTDGASKNNNGVDSGKGNSATAVGSSNKNILEIDIAEKQDGSPSAKVDDGTSTSQGKDDGVAPDNINSNPKVSSSDDHAYDLPTDDEGGENNTAETTSNPKISMSPSNKEKEKDDDTSEIDLLNASSTDKEEDDDSDIELLDAEAIRAEQQKQQQEAAASKPAAAAASKSNNDDDSDEELEIMGTTNEQKFPHNRKECLDYRYNANSTSTTTGDNPNAKFCSLCYCYVCDKKASECENWYLGEKGICTEITADNDDGGGKVKKSNAKENATAPHNNHCNAQDKGDQKYLWQNMRNAVKNGRDPSKVTNSYMPEPATLPDPLQQYMANYSTSHTSAGHRNHATSRGRHSHGGGAATATSTTGGGTYGSTTYAAARSRSAPPPPRRRRREGSSGTKRPAQADHRARIRTQQMLEDLYG